MKRIFAFLLFSAFVANLQCQETDNKTVVNRTPTGKFFRPSLTVLFVDRGESVSNQLIGNIESLGISDKYNDNSVVKNRIPSSIGINESGLENYIESNITGRIVSLWFPFDKDANQHSLDVVAERGMYNATDADVIKAKASVRGEGMLKDVGYELINKSYFLVYDLYDVAKTIVKDDKGNESKVYKANCDLYLFQLDWNDQVIGEFSKKWTNPEAAKSLSFPVKKFKFILKNTKLTPVTASCTTDRSKATFKEDTQLLSDLASSIAEKIDIIVTQSNTDFQAQGSIFKMDPIRAKIGLKDGIKVNQRWFVYELEQKKNNQVVQKRKGVIRATAKINDNRSVSTGESATTQFYQTYGGRLYEGMLLQQKPDFGLGFSGTFGTDVNLMVETYAGMERVRVYARLAMSIVSDDAYFGIGLSKEYHFMRIFSVAPFIGISPDLENLDTIKGYGLDAGLNGCLYVLHNLQLFTQASINTKSNSIANVGIGIRILY